MNNIILQLMMKVFVFMFDLYNILMLELLQ